MIGIKVRFSHGLNLAIACSAAFLALLFSVALLRENLRLRAELEQVGGGLSGPARALVGDRVPSFQAVTLNGRKIFVPGRKGCVLLFFSPKCRVCEEHFPLWERLSGEINRECWDILGISLDPLEETAAWAQSHARDFEIASVPDRTLWRAYRVTAIPQAVVVSPHGIILWVHSGALREDEPSYSALLSIVRRCREHDHMGED
ncbi:Thiol-disulfide oxidoreductase ResA [bacterium HR08]|nr:Thiol-disulfide oxidoreductase ResA [bacterium HR08]